MGDDAHEQGRERAEDAKRTAEELAKTEEERARTEAERLVAEALTGPMTQEMLRQLGLIYGGLILIGLYMVQPFLTAPSLDASAKVSILAFSVAIPLLAALVMVNRQEAFRGRQTPSITVTLGRVVAQLAAFVGIVAGFWHITWIAGVGIPGCRGRGSRRSLGRLLAPGKDERADVLSAETSPATQLRLSAAITRAVAGPASPVREPNTSPYATRRSQIYQFFVFLDSLLTCPNTARESVPSVFATLHAALVTTYHAQPEPDQCAEQRHDDGVEPQRPGEAPE